ELELELLLRTGQAEKARVWLLPEHAEPLGEATYHWLRVQALAAVGDYAAAREEFSGPNVGRQDPDQVRSALAATVAEAVLDGWPGGNLWPDVVGRTLAGDDYLNRLRVLTVDLRRVAEATAIRGLLAREEGDVGAA